MSNRPFQGENMLAPIYLRPALYVGDTEVTGIHTLATHVINYAMGEVTTGHCTQIHVTLHADDVLTIAHNGRAIPLAEDPEEGRTILEVVMTTPLATVLAQKPYFAATTLGSKELTNNLCVVNALAEFLAIDAYTDGWHYRLCFERGRTVGAPEKIAPATRQGIALTFTPDRHVFGNTIHFDPVILIRYLRPLAYLNPALQIYFSNEVTGEEVRLQYAGGIAQYIEEYNRHKAPRYPVIHASKRFGDIHAEVAWQYHSGTRESLFAFVNNLACHEESTHVVAFHAALTGVMNEYARKYEWLPTHAARLSGKQLRSGLTAVIAVRLPEPRYWNSLVPKIVNREVYRPVYALVREAVSQFFDEEPATRCDFFRDLHHRMVGCRLFYNE